MKLLARLDVLLAAFSSTIALLFTTGAPANGQQPIEIDVPAPELVGTVWLNTPDGKSVKLAARKGKVTVVEFWTFG
jgi:hypothetical protein